jgi:hypothetical protein
MLFTYAAIDYYLPKKGVLAFLITQEVFKAKGAGEGFRRFCLGPGGDFRVIKAHDLVTVQPFEGAVNKTAMIVVEKGKPTRYPVAYTVWTRRKGVGKIPTDTPPADARAMLHKKRLSARPIGKPTGAWQTVSASQAGLVKIEGHNPYKARRGASTEPYGVFWLNLEQVMADGDLLVRNMHDRGKRTIQPVQERIEKDLVFPAVCGRDIERWQAKPGMYVLVVQDTKTRAGYSEKTMKEKYPRTYSYLVRFKSDLLARAAYVKYHADEHHSFYSQYNVADYSFARYRVVWKRMASDLVAAVVSQHKTPFGHKTIIATDTTSLFPTQREDEAHYLCAIINSKPVREFLKSFSSAGRGFGAPSVMEPIGIPEFDGKNPLHCQLASLSKELHNKKVQGQNMECLALELEVDDAAGRLFGLKETK